MTTPETPTPPERGVSRVTIDIDSYHPQWQLTAVKAVYNARAAGAVEVDVRVSSSGEGIHLVVWFDRLLTAEAKARLRELWGDDPHRRDMDAVRGEHHHTTNVLWSEKGDQHAERHYDDIWHALESIETQTRDLASIPHGFANDGRKAVGSLAYPTKTPHPTDNESN